MEKINYPSWPTYSRKEINLVSSILKTGKTNFWTGKYCNLFENKFAKYFSRKFAISVSSGSVALDLAVKSLGLKKNDEVLVTPRSYIASASCVVSHNLKPIFVDVDLDSQNILPDDIERKITKKTKAIILVHLAGHPCEMSKIIKICKLKKIKIIEDCSQAHGAKYKSKFVGSFGDISIWSFCNDKIMSTCGEGGMITTNHYKYFKKIWALKDCGKNIEKIRNSKFTPKFKWIHDTIGSNYRMTELQASVGIFQLNQLKKWTQKRNFFSNRIYKLIKKYDYIRIPHISKNLFHSFYRCYFFIDLKKIKNRANIISALRDVNIQCNVGSCPEIYLEKAFNNQVKKMKRLKNAKILGETSIALFINHNFTRIHQNIFLKILKKVLDKYK